MLLQSATPEENSSPSIHQRGCLEKGRSSSMSWLDTSMSMSPTPLPLFPRSARHLSTDGASTLPEISPAGHQRLVALLLALSTGVLGYTLGASRHGISRSTTATSEIDVASTVVARPTAAPSPSSAPTPAMAPPQVTNSLDADRPVPLSVLRGAGVSSPAAGTPLPLGLPEEFRGSGSSAGRRQIATGSPARTVSASRSSSPPSTTDTGPAFVSRATSALRQQSVDNARTTVAAQD